MDVARPLIAAALIAGCTGQEVQFRSLRPELAVLPESLDYGEVVANEQIASLPAFVENNGLATLEADLRLEGPDAFSFVLTTEALVLEPDESAEVLISFTPDEVRGFEAELVVESNDPEQRFWVVPVVGTGRVPYAPDIEIRPLTSLDFGTVDVGESETEFFEIYNAGDANLIVGSVVQEGAGTFSLASDPSGSVVAPLQSKAVLVDFSPIQASGDSGLLRINSNDEDEPEVVVDLTANGGGVFEYPEAVIDCPGSVDMAGPLTVTLDGSASTDPGGRPLTYWWELVRRPSGADPSREPDPQDEAVTELLIEAAGTWEVSLVVENDLDPPVPSVPTKCVIEAVPVDNIHVEVSWSGPTADFDLHLSQEDAEFYDVPGDASWCNPNPDWGASGDPTDDPRLDLDDNDGFGPENINITQPEPGVYHVRVHHYDDGDDGTVTGTVQVFTHGGLAWEGSAVLARNEVWEVGQINWPDGTFGVSSEPAWDAGGLRECQ